MYWVTTILCVWLFVYVWNRINRYRVGEDGQRRGRWLLSSFESYLTGLNDDDELMLMDNDDLNVLERVVQRDRRRNNLTNRLIAEAKAMHCVQDNAADRIMLTRFVERRFRELGKTGTMRIQDAVMIKSAVIEAALAPCRAEIRGAELKHTTAFRERHSELRRARSAWSLPSVSHLLSVASGSEPVESLWSGPAASLSE